MSDEDFEYRQFFADWEGVPPEVDPEVEVPSVPKLPPLPPVPNSDPDEENDNSRDDDLFDLMRHMFHSVIGEEAAESKKQIPNHRAPVGIVQGGTHPVDKQWNECYNQQRSAEEKTVERVREIATGRFLKKLLNNVREEIILWHLSVPAPSDGVCISSYEFKANEWYLMGVYACSNLIDDAVPLLCERLHVPREFAVRTLYYDQIDDNRLRLEVAVNFNQWRQKHVVATVKDKEP